MIRAALAEMGYRLYVEFSPWRRTVAAAGHEAGFIGYFVEYLSDEIAHDCLLSKPIVTGPSGFAKRADEPIRWHNLDDLSRYSIGVMDDYINTAALDRCIHEHEQPADAAHTDAQNLIKPAAKRVSLAVIDRRVFEYLTQNDPRIRKLASQLRFNSRLFGEKQLFVCFRRDQHG